MATDLTKLIADVYNSATELVEQANGSVDIGKLDDTNLKAQFALKALMLSEQRREGYRAVQAALVTGMVRDKESLWLAHPPTDEYPQGFGSLREFLYAAGIKSTATADLCRLEQIVPYCDENNIAIDQYFGDRYKMLVEAGPTLRKAAVQDDREAFDNILADVESASSRDDIRQKYAEHRSPDAQGAVLRLSDGTAVMVVKLDDADDVGQIVSKLGSRVGWRELVCALSEFASSTRITINEG